MLCRRLSKSSVDEFMAVMSEKKKPGQEGSGRNVMRQGEGCR
jgi:hypothetical protein